MRSTGAADSYVLMLIGAALVLAASMMLDLSTVLAGLGAGIGLLLAVPVLDALRERLGSNTPALLAAAAMILLALKGFAGLG